MYEVYLDDRMLPIPPEKIPIKYSGQNKTMNLMNGEEVNLIQPPGLAEISLDFILPQMSYPAAVWDGSVSSAEDFLDHLRELKESKGPFEFIVIRGGSWARNSFDTCMDVTLEEYKVSDDVKEGIDLVVSVSLKEFRNYGTKIMNFVIQEETAVSTEVSDTRQGEVPPVKTYTVAKGDCLWSIAKKQLGNGARWPEIHNLNKDKISNPNLIHSGQVLNMP